MVGSRLSKPLDLDDIFKKIKIICKNNPKEESCGLVSENGLHHLENVSEFKAFIYEINPVDYKKVRDEGVVSIFWHSHAIGGAIPSPMDTEYSLNSDLLCLIYSVKYECFSIFDPLSSDIIYFSI